MFKAPPTEPIAVFIDWDAFHCTDFAVSVDTETMYSSSRIVGTQMRTGETISMTVMAADNEHMNELLNTLKPMSSPSFIICIIDGIEYYNEDISRLAVTRETRAFDQSTDMSMREIEIQIA